MKITLIIKDCNRILGYELSENGKEKRVSAQDLIRVNPKLENATIRHNVVYITENDVPVMYTIGESIDSAVEELNLMNKKLSVLTGEIEPIEYKVTEKGVEIKSVTNKICGEFKLPFGVSLIDEGAFYRCDRLKSVELPESIRFIAEGAFDTCELLETLNIPKGIEYVCSNAVTNCGSLKTIKVSGNPNIAFGTDWKRTTLTDVYIENGKIAGYEVSNINKPNTKAINLTSSLLRTAMELDLGIEYIISGIDLIIVEIKNKDMETIEIPEGVTRIDSMAIQRCSNLKHLRLPDSIVSLESDIISSCDALETVSISKDTILFCDAYDIISDCEAAYVIIRE